MMFKPYPLGSGRIDDAALAEDKKSCRKIGPCGMGEKALYLNSFFIDRRYYVPFSAVTRVYKRVAMSRGGFTGKGIFAFTQHNSFAVYFTLFGLAAIFTFAGFSVLPTARNNRTAIMKNDAQAQEKMQAYLSDYLNFPLPARYAHPVVLRRMQRVILDGRAVTAEQALAVVKDDLKALNADVQVSQEEYDEVVASKQMSLNAGYQ